MAAVEVTISGVLYDKLARTTRPVVLIGEASLTGLGVGGGPIIPPDPGPGDPPHIWGGGNEPFPTPPIANVPGIGNPDPPGKPSIDPIIAPSPPPPPQNIHQVIPPSPVHKGYGWFPDFGWGYFPPQPMPR